EHAAILSCDPDDQKNAFFRCWTRKEAYVKAHGDGLMRGLESFDVSVGVDAALLNDAEFPEETQRWGMASIDMGSLGFKAALAYERQMNDANVCCWKTSVVSVL
ncbi:MAG: 4'-phosphopantetheinyl transferase superfamily protein, partial [Methylococcales bacterium]|nr:4'-phosphopantetheinyl transferase superfamily protein [Methylococcales bacterium]